MLRKYFKFKHVFFFFCLFSPLCFGQVKNKLNWHEALAEVKNNNPELKSGREAVIAAQSLVSGSYSTFMPEMKASLSRTETKSRFSNLSVDNYTASLSASQNLFTGLSDMASIDQNKASAEISLSSLTALQAKISFELKSGFESLLYAQKSLGLTEQIMKRREENIKIVNLRYENGRENKGSLLLSEAYLGQARYDNLQAKFALEVAQAQLARLLGRNDFTTLEVEGEVPPLEEQEAPSFGNISKATPDYNIALSQQKSAEAGVVVARSGFFPILNLTASKGRQDEYFFPEHETWSVGLNLTLPFFSGFKDYYSMKSSQAQLRSSKFNVQNTDRQVVFRLDQAYTNFLLGRERYKMDQGFLKATTVRAEIARSKYNNGLLTFEDWDIIEGDLINRQKIFLQTQRDKLIAEAAWEQAQGKGVLNE